MKLHIDTSQPRAELIDDEGSQTFTDRKWVEFYAALALNRRQGSGKNYLSAEELRRYGHWQTMKADSVGRIVRRHVRELRPTGKRSPVQSPPKGKTKQWRLKPMEILFVPDKSSVEIWLEAAHGQLLERVHVQEAIDYVATLATAYLNIIQAGTEQLEEYSIPAPEIGKGSIPEAFDGWRKVLEAKRLYKCEKYGELNDLFEEIQEYNRSILQAVKSRVAALVGMAERFESPEKALAKLTRISTELENAADASSRASLLNVMGLLERRIGNFEDSIERFLLSIAMFGIVGDLASLQGAIFNLSIGYYSYLKNRGIGPNERLLTLIDLCIALCTPQIEDSAQAESCGAMWAARLGQFDRASRYLVQAERILSRTPSDYELGCLHHARAIFHIEKNDPNTVIEMELNKAHRMFDSAGDEGGVNRIERLRCRLAEQVRES